MRAVAISDERTRAADAADLKKLAKQAGDAAQLLKLLGNEKRLLVLCFLAARGVAGLSCEFLHIGRVGGPHPLVGYCNGSHRFTSRLMSALTSAPISHYRVRHNLALTKLANADSCAKKNE